MQIEVQKIEPRTSKAGKAYEVALVSLDGLLCSFFYRDGRLGGFMECHDEKRLSMKVGEVVEGSAVEVVL